MIRLASHGAFHASFEKTFRLSISAAGSIDRDLYLRGLAPAANEGRRAASWLIRAV